jgi:spore cortex formation protein SpoVR/YcgB (stage V sporulation)
MKKQLLEAVLAHAEGHVKKHLANVEVYLQNPAGIGDHSDIIDSINVELEMVDKYLSKIQIVKEYFLDNTKSLING